jgi:malonyl-CoA O-methyltransferase
MVATELNRQQIKDHFSRHAEDYDRYALVQTRVVARLLELLRNSDLARGRCLEIGTGTGRFSAELIGQIPGLQPVLTDIAHGMTLHAARRLSGSSAVDADASCLPFAPAVFYSVVSASVYQWIEDLGRAFAEVRRVLCRGGMFAFALFGERSLYELRSSHHQALAELKAGRMSHAQEFPGVAEVASGLAAAGLQVRQLFSEQELEFHPSVPALLRSLKKIGAGNASVQRPPGLASRQVMQRMIDLYTEGFANAAGIPATYQVIYGLAGKCL